METPGDLRQVLTIKEVQLHELDEILYMNRTIFKEERLINRFDHPYMLFLQAEYESIPVGFKVGYGTADGNIFYSAKGGVIKPFRGRGVAKALMLKMLQIVAKKGYTSFVYDTFPKTFPGMFQLGLLLGFEIEKQDYNAEYGDWKHHLKCELTQDKLKDMEIILQRSNPKTTHP